MIYLIQQLGLNVPNFISACLFLLLGVAAFFAVINMKLTMDLLSYDTAGWYVLGAGTAIFVVGLFVRDYAAANSLTMIALFVLLVGVWILLNNDLTRKILNTKNTKWYVIAALAWFLLNAGLKFHPRLLWPLAMPVGLGSFLFWMAVINLMPTGFKDRILPQDNGGWSMVKFGAATLVLSVFGGANLDFYLAAAVVGFMSLGLGLTIAMPEWLTKIVIPQSTNRWVGMAYSLVAVSVNIGLASWLFYWSRTSPW